MSEYNRYKINIVYTVDTPPKVLCQILKGSWCISSMNYDDENSAIAKAIEEIEEMCAQNLGYQYQYDYKGYTIKIRVFNNPLSFLYQIFKNGSCISHGSGSDKEMVMDEAQKKIESIIRSQSTKIIRGR